MPVVKETDLTGIEPCALAFADAVAAAAAAALLGRRVLALALATKGFMMMDLDKIR